MARRNVTKQHRPLRTLSILLIMLVAIYASIGWGVATLPAKDSNAQSNDQASDQSTDQTSTDADSTASDTTNTDTTASTPDSGDGSTDNSATDNSTASDTNSTDSSDTAIEPDSEKTDDQSSRPLHNSDPVSFIPKFALDLAGGTELILKAQTEDGSTPDDNALDRAIDVIRQRIDASGVAEAEISKQGASNIVVGIPGETPSDETIKLISNAAKMSFRPVVALGGANGKYYTAAMGQKSVAQSETNPDASKYDQNGNNQIDTPEEIAAYTNDINNRDKEAYDSAAASDTATGTSKFSEITEDDIKAFDELDCTKEENRKGGSDGDPTKAIATCDKDGTGKYMLAPVAVEGDEIDRAQAGLQQLSSGKTGTSWVVSLKFKDAGDDKFIDISKQVKVLDQPRNQFAITLDGLVISAPSIQKDTNFVKGNGVEISSGGQNETTAQTRVWATTLANQLSFGALPMNFEVDSKEQISATLGGEQLEKGLLAGIFGLLLVILFSLFQYRALGLVTVGSLTIASLFTYGVILLLSWQIGYRLSLPGIIGFIVSIGITADSFIVYFERIRDELRDGRSLDMSVTRGWQRAKQTILASDTVNVLCAVILYLLAVGGVRGFAFTLGLTTFIDLIVVFMFTHPLVALLSKLHFFKFGHPLSGLSAFALGASNAKLYSARSQDELDEIREEKAEKRENRKRERDELREMRNAAKDLKHAQSKESKLHKIEHEALMEKKAELLKAGADIEDIMDIQLTQEEKALLARGKSIKKLYTVSDKKTEKKLDKKPEKRSDKKVEAKTDIINDKKVIEGKNEKSVKKSDEKSTKKSPTKPVTKSVVKPAGKTSAKSTTTKSTVKSAVKTTAKSTVSSAKKPATKPAVKKTTTTKTKGATK